MQRSREKYNELFTHYSASKNIELLKVGFTSILTSNFLSFSFRLISELRQKTLQAKHVMGGETIPLKPSELPPASKTLPMIDPKTMMDPAFTATCIYPPTSVPHFPDIKYSTVFSGRLGDSVG